MQLRSYSASVLLLAATALTPSCVVVLDGWGASEWDGLRAEGRRGSGVLASEERAPGSFSEISVLDAIDLSVTVGPETAAVVEGDDNLLPGVRTDARDGVLVVEFDDDRGYRSRVGLRVAVTTPTLSGVHLCGSSDADVRGVDAERFVVSVEGSGDATVEGRTRHLQASISGSGDLDLAPLAAATAELSISGSGDIETSVSERLEASIRGSGDIRYHGRPATSVSVSGSGSVGRE